jgi:hypothetical protein
MQHEITSAGPLLGPDGRLLEAGFSRRHLLEYNPQNALPGLPRSLAGLRLKEWDYYGVTGKDHFFSITVSSIGYLGLVFAYLIDFRKRTFIERNIATPFGRGISLPPTSRTGDIGFDRSGARVSFLKKEGARELSVFWANFHQGMDLDARLTLSEPPGRDSIVMATPISDRRFYYNEKIPAMPSRGVVTLDKQKIEFDEKDSFAVLDWGRGVWEYSTFWNWSSAGGRLPDGRTLGINIGQGFGDLSAASENCFFLNGKMHKLGTVDWKYTSGDWLQPWTFESGDGRARLTMTPIVDRPSSVNLLVLRSSVHQVFGRYTGTLVCDDGEVIQVPGIIGWAEEHRARW